MTSNTGAPLRIEPADERSDLILNPVDCNPGGQLPPVSLLGRLLQLFTSRRVAQALVQREFPESDEDHELCDALLHDLQTLPWQNIVIEDLHNWVLLQNRLRQYLFISLPSHSPNGGRSMLTIVRPAGKLIDDRLTSLSLIIGRLVSEGKHIMFLDKNQGLLRNHEK